MIRVAALVVGALLLLGLAASPSETRAAADPQASTSDAAVPLTRKLSGHLEPGMKLYDQQQATIAYYRFFYPADGSAVTVSAEVAPDDPVVLKNVAMKVFDPSGREVGAAGPQAKVVPNLTTRIATSNRQQAGTYTVQLANYNPGSALDFQIWADGLPPQPDLAPGPLPPTPSTPVPTPRPSGIWAPAGTMTPGAAVPLPTPFPTAPPPTPGLPVLPPPPDNSTPDGAAPLRPGQPASGTLAPSAGGSFAYFQLVYPGDGSTLEIDLQVDPDDAAVLANAGFRVYGPLPGRDYASKLYLTGGQRVGSTPNVSGNLVSTVPGLYVVQLYSYAAQATVAYTLSVPGLPPQPPPGPAPYVSPAPTTVGAAPQVGQWAPPALPTALVAASPFDVVTPTPLPTTPFGKLWPNDAGPAQAGPGFAGHLAPGQSDLYQFQYPGDREVYTVNLQVAPDNAALLRNVGFRVYRPPDKVYVEGGAQPGLRPNVSGNLIGRDPGTYTVEVFNRDATVAIDYEVTLDVGPVPSEDQTRRPKGSRQR